MTAQKSDVPFDRLTELADEMEKPLDRPENDDVKGIIFLHDAEKGGIAMSGYDDAMEGVADLMIHLKAIFEANGKSFGVMTDQGVMLIPETPRNTTN